LISRSVFDGSALHIALSGELDYITETIDVKGLAAPLKVARRVVDMIPILGRPLANRFTTIPFKATGKWQDPKVETTFIWSIAPGLVSALEELGKGSAGSKDAEANPKE
jgi:hypothetical protein